MPKNIVYIMCLFFLGGCGVLALSTAPGPTAGAEATTGIPIGRKDPKGEILIKCRLSEAGSADFKSCGPTHIFIHASADGRLIDTQHLQGENLVLRPQQTPIDIELQLAGCPKSQTLKGLEFGEVKYVVFTIPCD